MMMIDDAGGLRRQVVGRGWLLVVVAVAVAVAVCRQHPFYLVFTALSSCPIIIRGLKIDLSSL